MLLSDRVLSQVVDQALSLGADFAEVYVEDTRRREFALLDRKPHKASSGHLLGAGIRLFKGNEQIYTYTNDLTSEGLLKATRQAAVALKASGRTQTAPVPTHEPFGQKYETLNDGSAQWVHLAEIDTRARHVSSLITQVHTQIIEVYKQVQVYNSEGIHRSEARNYRNAFAQVYAEDQGQKESGYDRLGDLGTETDWNSEELLQMADKAAAQSLRILKADWASAGEMPVVIDNGFGGVIFHEACGHGLETTSVAKNASVFCGKLGQKIAHESVTAIDDGTILGQYGSLEIDDEGEPTRRTVLIENGILKSYIVDKIGARKTGYAVTGSGRRQDYRFAPTSRMRNTFIAPGQATLEELIKDVDHGLYARTLGGGSVSPGTGAYNFAVAEAYVIEGGKLGKQVKGASLIGTGIETLGRITKVGKDLKLAPGTCGSVSGSVPVTVGQPPILVSRLTVGGKV